MATETRREGLVSLDINPPEVQPKGRIRKVIFDWYGTLYDCMAQFPIVFAEEMHGRFGVNEKFAYRNFLRNAGFSWDVQMEDLLGTEKFISYGEEVIKATKIDIANRLDDLDASCFEDVPGALYILKNKGYELSILSNNKEGSIRRQMRNNDISEAYFDMVVGRDSCLTCSEKGEEGLRFIANEYQKKDDKLTYGKLIGTSVLVTDMAVDAERSFAGGVPVIARRGFIFPDQRTNPLFQAKAEWVVNDFTSLAQILEIM